MDVIKHGFRPARDDEVEAGIALRDRAGMTRPWNSPRDDIEAIRANPKSLPPAAHAGVLQTWLETECQRACREITDAH